MKRQSLYEVLGVSKTADASTIKKAYRKLAKANHPDVNPGDAQAEARFKEISAAYDVLSDREKRSLYDEFGEVALSPGFDADQARAYQQAGYGGQAGFDAGGFDFGGFGGADIFSELFGFGRQAPRGAQPRGQHMRSEVVVDFETAALGGQRTLQFAGQRAIDVRIPSGVQDGETLRLRGQGQPSAMGAPAGDLLLTVRVTPHAVFRREGLDLHMDLSLSVPEATLGTTVAIETLKGKVSLKVPPHTNSGRTLRLRGKGIARKNKGQGDLYVHIGVRVPQQMTPELKEALEVIRRHEQQHAQHANVA